MIRSARSQFQTKKNKAISIKFQANALNITKTMYFIINSSTEGYYIGRSGVIGGVEFHKIGQRGGYVHSTSWKFTVYFVDVFKTDWNFFTKLGSFDPKLNWTTLKLLYLKFETSAPAQIAFIHYYTFFTSFLT